MNKVTKRILAFMLTLAMVVSTLVNAAPVNVEAAPIKADMAHLGTTTANGNGHFTSTGTPEAFVLSEKSDIADADFSFTTQLVSDVTTSRYRFVNKYIDDNNWAYIGYDCGGNVWYYQYKNDGSESWSSHYTELPAMVADDVVSISGTYTDNGLELTIVNETTELEGTAVINDASFLAVSTQAGKIGFGGGYRPTNGDQHTEFNFWNVESDGTALGFSDFAPYENSADFTWKEIKDVVVGDDGIEEEPVEARKWFVLQGGSNNSGGHNYGSGRGPLFYTDTEKTMESGALISMALKPSNNWGVFYSYIDDSNWLYVGYDNSSKWYYQYKWNGSESYPQISGLPDPVEGEELSLAITLNNETLEVTVNGTTARVTNQTLKDMANAISESNGSLGKFGVMTKGATKISFADFKYNNEDCMADTWAFNFERTGQTMTEEVTAMETVTGNVTDASGNAVKDATVRIGTKSGTTDRNGNYKIVNVQVGTYTFSVSKPGYESYTADIVVAEGAENVFNAALPAKAEIDVTDETLYTAIESNDMTVYVGKDFPKVVRYVMKDDATAFFRGNETDLNQVVINGKAITPTVTAGAAGANARVYDLAIVDAAKNLDFTMTVKISVEDNTLTWQVTEINKNEGCAAIASIDIPELNLLTVNATEAESVFAGAQASTTTTNKADTYISFDDGFVPSNTAGYLYAFLSNGKLSAGLHSNSEAEGDKRVERINGADSMSLTSAVWYYEQGDKGGQSGANSKGYTYQVSELPEAKVAIAGDLNDDGLIDWNDGAIAFRDIMHYPQGYELVKDNVNHRIVMNFASSVGQPFLKTADNIKKVYLNTDGLPQAIVLKGYGNEGHDSANSEYADIAEREGGVEDMQDLIEIAHKYNTQIGIHVNAQEAYQEARSFSDAMVTSDGGSIGNGWGWLDQSVTINKLWDLSTDARLKRFVQLYDRLNGTDFYSGDWEEQEYAIDSAGYFTNGDGVTEVSREEVLDLVKADAAARPDNMDFIYLDVWYQDSWETRRIAEEINSLGWRFSTEFSAQGEYDSTWQHWSTEASYGGAGAKGFNSDIIRFLRNDHKDSNMINYPSYGGSADNPLLSGFELYGFEGWGSNQDYTQYIIDTFSQNVPSRFIQHYEVIKLVSYTGEAGDVSPVGNTEKEVTLKNDAGDVLVISRNEEQRTDDYIERTITLNGKVVLNTDTEEHTYLLPWTVEGEDKLYHWNEDGGTTTWDLQDDWAGLANVVVYELSDQGRINKETVAVSGGQITLTAEADTPYVVLKGDSKKELKEDFGEEDYVVDPGFNGYVAGEKLDAADWSGDIDAEGVYVGTTGFGNQRLVMEDVTEDVEVTTEIHGLEVGKHYVAEVYVENKSDAKATIAVDAGDVVSSEYTLESLVQNYHRSDSHNTGGKLPDSRMQRIMVTFIAEDTTATFTLGREAGEGTTGWDDIRIVEKELNNYKEDGSFEQDFETVVEGYYPFVLAGAQGVDDVRTHLSQANGKYTEKGWNGRIIDDTIDGEWSLKNHCVVTGIVYQTIPNNFRFEAGKVYTVEFDYQAGSSGYQMVVGDGFTYTAPTEYLAAASTDTHVTMQVVGSGSGQTWIGLYENGSRVTDGAWGQMDFILDNLVITEDPTAEVVTLSATDLLLNDNVGIYGTNLDAITWTMSAEGIVKLDQANNKLRAIGAGETTLTATFPSGTVFTFDITVVDTVVEDIPRSEFADTITISSNTEEAGGEGAVNGYDDAVIDGDGSTFWHSAWSSENFVVSESNPAILTVDLGKTMEIGGFKFQQRSQANRVLSQYSYKIKDADGNVVASADHQEVDALGQAAGAWVNVVFDNTVNAKVIEFSIEAGPSTHACLAELEPIRVNKIEFEEEKPPVEECKHTSTEVVNKKAATCTEEGYTGDTVCKKCGETVKKGTTIAKLAHTEVVDKAVAATCTSTGLTEGKHCSVCNTVLVAQEEVPALGHDWSEWKVTKEPTEDKAGEKSRECSRCDAKEIESIPATGANADVTAPTVPTELKATSVEKTVVKLSWKASADDKGVAGYDVYVNGEKRGTVTGTAAQISELTAATKYTFEIKAFDEAGNYSDAAAIEVTTKANTTGGGSTSGGSTSSGSTGSTTTTPTAPATGDSAQIFTWIAVAFVMAAGMAGFSVKRRRNR